MPESYKPSEWLSETMPRKAPYYPQMGDEVVYFRQGHQLYMNAVNAKKLYEINIKDIPWKQMHINVSYVQTSIIILALNIHRCFERFFFLGYFKNMTF